ncbi:MAG: hypothetical protein R2734_20190 [Nocardioides sp.]
MTDWTEASVAAELLACEAERRDRVKFTDDWPELDVDTGYRIQDETLRRRLARGESLTGVKLGLTSKAKQERMGVDTPLVAWLTDDMVLAPGDPVPQHKLIHPRVEPEIVFVMGERLEGPGMTADRALAAVARVHAGAEVIDSATATSSSPPATSSRTTPRPGPTSCPRSGPSPARSTSPRSRSGSRWTERSSTRARGPTCSATPPRRWPWRSTSWPAGAWRSRRAGRC